MYTENRILNPVIFIYVSGPLKGFVHFVKIEHFDLNSKQYKQSQLQFCQNKENVD